MKTHYASGLAATLMTIVLGGCGSVSGSSSETLPLQTLFASQQCGVERAQLIALQTPEQFGRFVAKSQRQLIGAAKPTALQTFPQGLAVVVAWGNKPSGGYRINLNSSEGVIDTGTLRLPVSFLSPPQSSFQTQAITSPCLIVGIAEKDGYQKIQAGELTLPLN